ncbi:hypothetical protein DID77_00700 [Candidatus Marinamargulisbacteria bacterium SCGC AG-439-L15]|nr:hypothetical protein DID77_00700 [Candidatus Marinamargulisbacteria bacterium SCGC AG-439-L15]
MIIMKKRISIHTLLDEAFGSSEDLRLRLIETDASGTKIYGNKAQETIVEIQQNGVASKIVSVGTSDPKKVPIFLFKLGEEKHEGHSHIKLVKQETTWLGILKAMAIPEIRLMGQSEEGCPCCMIGLDLDEIAAAMKVLANTSSGDTHLYGWADLDSDSYWIISPIVLLFATLGATAGFRNIKGSWQNWDKLTKIIKSIDQTYAAVENLMVRSNLKALRATLWYSKYIDTLSNGIGPGALNLIASVTAASTVVYHHPWAPLPIGLYSGFQCARNIVDLIRVRNWAVPEVSKVSDGLTVPNKQVMEGIAVATRLRKFQSLCYGAIATLFAMFSVGSFVIMNATFCLANQEQSSSNMTNSSRSNDDAPGDGDNMCHDRLYAGLSLFFIGALSTTILNNIVPRLFRPRNGELSFGTRWLLTEQSCLEELGRAAKQEDELRVLTYVPSTKTEWVCRGSKRFAYRIMTALPWGLKAGEKKLHKDSLDYFEHNKEEIMNRVEMIIPSLVSLKKGENTPVEKMSSIDAQLQGMSELGVLKDVLNSWLEDECCHHSCFHHTHSHECEHEHHKQGDTIERFKNSLKKLQKGHSGYKLFDLSTLSEEARQKVEGELKEKIAFYAFFKLAGVIDYDKYALFYHFFALQGASKDSVV